MKLKLMLSRMGQQQEQSWMHACGHIRSTEGRVVESEEEYQKGVNLPHWSHRLEHQENPDDGKATVGVRQYQKYSESRETLFTMFPQIDTEVLEAEAIKLASNKQSDLVETMDRMAAMAEHLETNIAANSTTISTTSKSNSCQYFQVQVANNEIPQTESSKPECSLARSMLEEYNKAGGSSYADRYKRVLYNITCVQNPKLESNFYQGRNRLEKQEGGAQQREYILYHGTRLKNAMEITKNGFAKDKINSTPKGFFFSTWPGIPLKYGGPEGTVVLVCKVLLGYVRFEANAIEFEGRKVTKQFIDCNSMVRKCSASSVIRDESLHKPVTRRIFIIPEPDQILPVGMLIFYLPDHFQDKIPTPETPFRQVPDHYSLNRMISPSRIYMKEVIEVIAKLKEKKCLEEINRRIKYFEDMIDAYEKPADLCLKCGLAISKATSTALAEFLEWADSTQGGGDKELQEATYYMGSDDLEQSTDEDGEDGIDEDDEEG